MVELHLNPTMSLEEKVKLVMDAMEENDQILLVEEMAQEATHAIYTNYLNLLNRTDLMGATYDLQSLELEGKLVVKVVITNKQEI